MKYSTVVVAIMAVVMVPALAFAQSTGPRDLNELKQIGRAHV